MLLTRASTLSESDPSENSHEESIEDFEEKAMELECADDHSHA